MSEFEIDKLFREKLSGRKSEPSDQAWSRLSSSLNKNKNRYPWLVAASVVFLLGVAGYFFLSAPKVDNLTLNNDTKIDGDKAKDPEIEVVDQQVSEDKTGIQDAPQQSLKTIADQSTAIKEEVTKSRVVPVEKQKEEAPGENLNPGEATMAILENEIMLEEMPQALLSNETDSVEPGLEDEVKTALAVRQEAYPEIRIIYKASERQPEDKTALRKVVALARDIKEADIGLGTLREAKNELLAFGFKKTKELGN